MSNKNRILVLLLLLLSNALFPISNAMISMSGSISLDAFPYTLNGYDASWNAVPFDFVAYDLPTLNFEVILKPKRNWSVGFEINFSGILESIRDLNESIPSVMMLPPDARSLLYRTTELRFGAGVSIYKFFDVKKIHPYIFLNLKAPKVVAKIDETALVSDYKVLSISNTVDAGYFAILDEVGIGAGFLYTISEKVNFNIKATLVKRKFLGIDLSWNEYYTRGYYSLSDKLNSYVGFGNVVFGFNIML